MRSGALPDLSLSASGDPPEHATHATTAVSAHTTRQLGMQLPFDPSTTDHNRSFPGDLALRLVLSAYF
jgi:hypothetical protein